MTAKWISTAFISLLCLGCGDDPYASIQTGTYQLVEEDNGNPIAEFEGMRFAIDVTAKTFVVTWPEDAEVEPFTTQLVDVPQGDWKIDCPTNFSATKLETYTLTDALTLGENTLEDAFIFAAGCDTTAASNGVWISTDAHDAETSQIGSGLHYLEILSGE